MKDLLNIERNEYEVVLPNILLFYSSHASFLVLTFVYIILQVVLLPVMSGSTHALSSIDILELNRMRRGLILDAYTWDCRLCNIDSLKTSEHISQSSPFNQKKS